MEHDRADLPDQDVEQGAPPPAPATDTVRPTPRNSPFTLASLLDIDEAELAEPLPRVAPTEHRWEQLTLGVLAETGETVPSPLRSTTSSDVPPGIRDLVPGLDVPGAMEVPVYLAGRALDDLLAGAESPRPPAAVNEPSVLDDAAWGVSDDHHPTVPPPRPVDDTRSATARRLFPVPVTAVKGPSLALAETAAATAAHAAQPHVLWPTKRSAGRTTAGGPPARGACPTCHTPLTGDTCAACRADLARRDQPRTLRRLIMSGLQSESRVVRTLTALVCTPGELTAAHLAGQTTRFLGPAFLALLALLLFSVISTVGSLRPRPDRALSIGRERTAEVSPGLTDRSPAEIARGEAPGVIRTIAAGADFVPVIWFPIAGVVLLGAVATLRAPERRDGDTAAVFTAHVLAWFVVWWGLAVPAILLVVRYGFEGAAALSGVTQVQQRATGDVVGLPAAWNAARHLVTTGTFHSALLTMGLLPWLTIAWDRCFESGRPKAVAAALILTAIPVLLLVPFA